MSWSKSYKSQQEFADHRSEGSGSDSLEAKEQFEAAAAAAQALVDSGVVGSADKRLSIVLSGHANPGHEPRSGWASDTVTVTISQLA
jgi:hypothetical protein